jgi:transposase
MTFVKLLRTGPQTRSDLTHCCMTLNDLSDGQWERLRPLLPLQKPRTGRPAKDHRTVLNGILWILRTGNPWRALPEGYGSWKTVSSRFYRWQRARVWDRVLAEVQRQADAEGRLDWSLHFVDSIVVRAHRHAAGAKRGTQQQRLSAAVAADTAQRSISGVSGAVSQWCWR